jgi:hypothetical protein
MPLIKNLGCHSLPPLRRISSRDLKLQEEVGKGSWIEVLPIGLSWSVFPQKIEFLPCTVSCSEVLILMLEIWAIMSVMPGLSTIVAQMEWKVSGLGNLLLAFLDEAELLLLLFLS